jgi:hydroxysqualene synthase
VVTPDLDAAYASCERRARAHYENFPVASVLLPPGTRRHIAAIYAFARAADDFADEGSATGDERIRLLDGWLDRLHRVAAGDAQPDAQPGEPDDTPAIFAALGNTIRVNTLPIELLTDLITAFKQDVTVHRYQNWEALFDYARRSANPVGRLVLRIAGYRATDLDAWSDAICTALQFTNFWQDFHVDLARGRVYLPQSELVQQGAAPGELAPTSAAVECALRQAVGRTRQLFMTGRPLCDAVRGRLRYEMRATWLGGVRILDRVEQQLTGGTRRDVGPQADPHAVAFARPTLQLSDAPWFAWRLITWAPR